MHLPNEQSLIAGAVLLSLGAEALCAQQQPVFRANARLVVCHTTVVDKNGHLVTNLAQQTGILPWGGSVFHFHEGFGGVRRLGRRKGNAGKCNEDFLRRSACYHDCRRRDLQLLTHFHSGGHMSEVVYRSEVRIERVKGPVRRAYLPAESQPVTFGVHGAVAEHYKVPAAVLEPHATTLDYIVAAAAG
jgi:hypothetical protein